LQLGKRTFLVFLLGNVTILAIVVCLAGYYYVQCQNYNALIKQYEAVTIRANLCINYGNGTVLWYNETILPVGCNLLNATKRVAVVNSTYYPTYEANFVNAINGVCYNSTHYWMWLRWDENENDWKYGSVGADLYILKPDETLMWRYEKG